MAAIYHDEKGEIGGGIAGVSVAEESGIWIGKKKKKNKKSLENYGGEKKNEKKRFDYSFNRSKWQRDCDFWRVFCNE